MSITSTSSDVISTRQPTYKPDYTVRAVTNLLYLCIKRHQYMAAFRATLMERQPKTPQVLGQLQNMEVEL